MSEPMDRQQLQEHLNTVMAEIHTLVIDAAGDQDGAFLGYPRAYAYAMDLVYTAASKKEMKFPNIIDATTEQLQNMIQLVEECIADWKAQNAYFHERRSPNNIHRDRVITFEQIAE